MKALPPLSAVLLLCSAVLLAAPQDGPDIDFSHDLGLPVGETFYVGQPADALARMAAALVGEDAAFLEDVRFYRGPVRQGAEEVDCLLAHVPFGAPLEGARLVLAMNPDGTLLTAGCWGIPEFDEDPVRRWTPFLSSLLALTAGDGPEAALTRREAEAFLDDLPAEDARLSRALIDLRRIMQGNFGFVTQVRHLAKTGELPAEGSLDPLIVEARRFEELTPLLEPMLAPPELESFAELGRELTGTLEELAGLEDAATFAEIATAKFSRNSQSLCRRCHNAPLGDGASFRTAIETLIEETELPASVLEVGFDVPRAMGDDADWSAAIAKKYRAAVYAMRGFDEDG